MIGIQWNLQFRGMKNNSERVELKALKASASQQNKLAFSIPVFQTIIIPLCVPPFSFSFPRSLFLQCDWLGWFGCHGTQIPICGPHAAAGARKRTAHTGHYGNTPPRGPLYPSRDTGLFFFEWTPRSSSLHTTRSRCALTGFTLTLLAFTSWFARWLLWVVTWVCVRVISRTKKAELPSSLWHVTVKSP